MVSHSTSPAHLDNRAGVELSRVGSGCNLATEGAKEFSTIRRPQAAECLDSHRVGKTIRYSQPIAGDPWNEANQAKWRESGMTSTDDPSERIRGLLRKVANAQGKNVPCPPKHRRLCIWAPLNGRLRLAASLDWGPRTGEIEITRPMKWESGRFQYTADWLEADGAYPLDPINLPLTAATTETIDNEGIPGVLTDGGPDGWGASVLARLHSDKRCDPFDRVLATLGRGVGALFATQSDEPSPTRTVGYEDDALDPIEEACWRLHQGEILDSSAYGLLREHCAALGGARPKAALVQSGREVIAKFQWHHQDYWDVPRVEAACLAMAPHAGIDAACGTLTSVNGRSVLLVDRFDRWDGRSLHYLSARSLLNALDDSDLLSGDSDKVVSYKAIVDAAIRIGVDRAGEAMFRRMAFNYAIGNTDDHLRNHGFLFDGAWRLAPAFDLVVVGGTHHALRIGEKRFQRTAENVLSRPGDFGLSLRLARELLDQAIEAARGIGPELDRLEMPAKQQEQVMSRLCAEARK